MSMKNKLNRMKKHLKQESESGTQDSQEIKNSVNTAEALKNRTLPKADEWEAYGVKPFFFNEEYCLIREVTYPLDFKHGIYTLGELLPVVEMWQNTDVTHPLTAKGHHPKDLFFFDTETTGLSGGTGTTIFLLGYARIMEDKVIVRQHLLPGPGNEVALYQSFLQEVDYTTLVTYNGKAFDWPQVKTRHTLIREHVPKLPLFGHYDLLHAARRLWKEKLESVRLANVEKEILGILREDDIPGFLAPMIYFDFVKTNELQGIKGVLKHNEWDVLTLITLYTHLSKLLQVEAETRNQKEEYEIGRWFDSLGEKETAASLYENILEDSWEACYKLGLLKKKKQKFQQAQDLFLQSYHHKQNTKKEIVGIELSKLFEHQVKDYPKALGFAEEAWGFWKEKQVYSIEKSSPQNYQFEKRISRLQKKINK
ncbi:ribonuclease H-like domain-containing protein [Sutcliffiella deserti]|uniref:ribonuclease H-like domain-containing protein n=1 Tax=Sutcliffiella deserti TaxID=2875501 RepID=UPI001CBC516C|nr:ribonuclease H-like domain-containing protein [Sutcliffiella deserti]